MNVTRDRSRVSLVEALRLLPNIRPIYERHRLGETKLLASLSPDRTASINGVRVTLAELDELFLQSESGKPEVSPEGAALLLRLFERGAFDFFERRPVERGLELLTQYSKSLATLIEPRYWRKVRRDRPPAPTKGVTQKRVRTTEVSAAGHRAELVGIVHRPI